MATRVVEYTDFSRFLEKVLRFSSDFDQKTLLKPSDFAYFSLRFFKILAGSTVNDVTMRLQSDHWVTVAVTMGGIWRPALDYPGVPQELKFKVS